MLYFCPIGPLTLIVNNAKWAPTSKFLKNINFFLKPVVKNNMEHIKEPYFEQLKYPTIEFL